MFPELYVLPELMPPIEFPWPQIVPVPEHPLPAFCANPVMGVAARPRPESVIARAIVLIMMIPM